jgi:hypothetical protein
MYTFEIRFNKIEAAYTNGSFKTRNDIQSLQCRIQILSTTIADLLPRVQNLITLSAHTKVNLMHREI